MNPSEMLAARLCEQLEPILVSMFSERSVTPANGNSLLVVQPASAQVLVSVMPARIVGTP